MRKKFIISLICLMLPLVGCNRQVFDTTYTFNYAYISLPNGDVISGEIDSWRDYEDGDQLQIKMKDGTTYLVHASNCTLVKTK